MPLAKAMFTGLLRIGFRNMPTDLALKLAAHQAIFAFLEAERGEGWWGAKSMADYYEQQSTGDDPFNWIKAHPLMPSLFVEGYPFDHAGHLGREMVFPVRPRSEHRLRDKGAGRHSRALAQSAWRRAG
jgi:creatinine amidohydrolase